METPESSIGVTLSLSAKAAGLCGGKEGTHVAETCRWAELKGYVRLQANMAPKNMICRRSSFGPPCWGSITTCKGAGNAWFCYIEQLCLFRPIGKALQKGSQGGPIRVLYELARKLSTARICVMGLSAHTHTHVCFVRVFCCLRKKHARMHFASCRRRGCSALSDGVLMASVDKIPLSHRACDSRFVALQYWPMFSQSL